MTGRRRAPGAGEGDPMEELEPVAAIARQLERVQRAQVALEEMLRGLAGDVAQLVASPPAQHEPPASWLAPGGEPARMLADLQWLAEWVQAVYLWYPGARLATCWLWHPAVVEELYCLAQAHREAYSPPTRSISKASEWHERFLPGVIRRLNASPLKDCDLTLHTPGAERYRTTPTPAPLADAARRIATEWIDQHIPDPTQLELNDSEAINKARTNHQN